MLRVPPIRSPSLLLLLLVFGARCICQHPILSWHRLMLTVMPLSLPLLSPLLPTLGPLWLLLLAIVAIAATAAATVCFSSPSPEGCHYACMYDLGGSTICWFRCRHELGLLLRASVLPPVWPYVPNVVLVLPMWREELSDMSGAP
jgi:hypothetical protein